MCQPKKWWWGLLPVAALFALMIGMTSGPIEADLARRSADVFASSGLPWAKAELRGRDAVVSGEAPSAESQKLATSAAERAWGVRQVTDRTGVSSDINPYLAKAVRQDNKVTLSGFVPSDAVRASLVSAAKASFPNAEVVDQLKFGRGASAAYAPALAFGIGQLGKLVKGEAAISDSAFSLTGQAADFAAFDQVTAAVKQLPAGATLAKAEITAPRVSPYVFSATKAADGLTLAGYVPTEAARSATLEAAKLAKGAKLADTLRVADGVPSGLDFGKATEFVYAQLGRLKTGAASLRDDALTISGQTDELADFDAVTAALKAALPGGLKLAAQDIKGPSAVSPYVWSADHSQPAAVTLKGFVPSEAVRGQVVDSAKKAFPGVNLVDQMKVAPGAAPAFGGFVNTALEQLGRLKTGVASLSDNALTISGQTDDLSMFEQVSAALKGAMPDGLKLGAQDIKGPAAVSPYVWSADHGQAGTVTLAGLVPSEAARAQIVEATKKALPGNNVVDQMKIAAGAAPVFGSFVNTALAQLGRLKTGVASLRDDALTISGQTDDIPVFEQISAALKGALPDGLKLASQDIRGPGPISPYTWSATKQGNAVTLGGWIPSENVRAPIVAAARKALPQAEVVDQMKLGLGAPNGFANAINAGLAQLGRLTSGVASIANTALKLTGEAADKEIADQVKAGLTGAGVPTGFSAETLITYKEPPPAPPPAAPMAPPAPPAVPAVPAAPPAPRPGPSISVAPALPIELQKCQDRFREILNKDTILFNTASATITAASRAGVLVSLASAVKACPLASVEVQGHTDADGSDEMNMELSNLRAAAVVTALEGLGAPAGQLKARGYGKTRPVATNDSPENKAKNRRIEFVVTQ